MAEISIDILHYLNSKYGYPIDDSIGYAVTIIFVLLAALFVAFAAFAMRSRVLVYVFTVMVAMVFVGIPLLLAFAFPGQDRGGWYSIMWMSLEPRCVLAGFEWFMWLIFGLEKRTSSLMFEWIFVGIGIMVPTIPTITAIFTVLMGGTCTGPYFKILMAMAAYGWIEYIFFPSKEPERKR